MKKLILMLFFASLGFVSISSYASIELYTNNNLVNDSSDTLTFTFYRDGGNVNDLDLESTFINQNGTKTLFNVHKLPSFTLQPGQWMQFELVFEKIAQEGGEEEQFSVSDGTNTRYYELYNQYDSSGTPYTPKVYFNDNGTSTLAPVVVDSGYEDLYCNLYIMKDEQAVYDIKNESIGITTILTIDNPLIAYHWCPSGIESYNFNGTWVFGSSSWGNYIPSSSSTAKKINRA